MNIVRCLRGLRWPYLELRTWLVLTAHTHDPGQMWIRCAVYIVVVVVVVLTLGPRRREQLRRHRHLALRPVLTSGDGDLLDGPGHGGGGDQVLIQLVQLGLRVLPSVLGRLLHLPGDGRRQAGSVSAHLGVAEVERVQVALQGAVVQVLTLQVALAKLLALWHGRGRQPRADGEGLNLPRDALGHDLEQQSPKIQAV